MAVSANRAVADVLRDYRAAIEDSGRLVKGPWQASAAAGAGAGATGASGVGGT